MKRNVILAIAIITQKAGCFIKLYLVFCVCSPDFSVGGLGGPFLPQAEIKGANNIPTKHMKTTPFLKNLLIP